MLRAWIIPSIMALLTIAIGLTLASGVVFAEDAVDDVSITVPVSCTMSGVGMNSHTASLNPGEYNSHIGETTMKVFCNDNEGYAVYAIGFTGDMFGNNKMVSTTLEDEEYIYTGTETSGEDSLWAMKLTTQTSPAPTYPIAIQNGFDDFHVVPSNYTLVAKSTAATDVGDNAIGASFTTTYQIYVNPVQTADTYVGKVKYTLVHPANEVPNQPHSCSGGKICYWPNAGASVADTMGDQSVTSSATYAVLWPYNFKRPGYGFIGWSTTYDYSDPDGFLGTQETVYFTAGKYNSKGLSLYAMWKKSEGTLQDWTGCNSLNVGDITALTDVRDNNTYAVAKLADGKCWMIENLRLNNDNSDNTKGLLAQGYNTNFKGLADSEAANFNDNTTANSLYYIGTQEGTATIDIGTDVDPASRMPRYNSRSTTDTVANMTAITNNVYGYGNYYNFAATVADYTGYTGTDVTLSTSICPKGWRLPKNTSLDSAGSDYWNLIVTSLGGGVLPDNMSTSSEPDYRAATQRELLDMIRKYPNNFIMAGYANGTSINGRGSNAQYASATSGSSTSTHVLFFNSSLTRPRSNKSNKTLGGSVRCLTGG